MIDLSISELPPLYAPLNGVSGMAPLPGRRLGTNTTATQQSQRQCKVSKTVSECSILVVYNVPNGTRNPHYASPVSEDKSVVPISALAHKLLEITCTEGEILIIVLA